MLAFQARSVGSIPTSVTIGRVAQLEERRLDTPEAAGSTPAATTRWSYGFLVHVWCMSTIASRRICFPVSDDEYRKIVSFCENKELTRGGFFLELMAAFFEKRHPMFSKKSPEPPPQADPVSGGGLHHF